MTSKLFADFVVLSMTCTFPHLSQNHSTAANFATCSNMKPKAKYSRLEGNEYDVELREAQLHDSKSYFTRTLSQAYYFFLHVVILFAALHAYFFYFTSFLGNPIKDIEIYSKSWCASLKAMEILTHPAPAAQALTLVIEERKDTHAHSSFTGFPNSVNTKAWEDLLLRN